MLTGTEQNVLPKQAFSTTLCDEGASQELVFWKPWSQEPIGIPKDANTTLLMTPSLQPTVNLEFSLEFSLTTSHVAGGDTGTGSKFRIIESAKADAMRGYPADVGWI